MKKKNVVMVLAMLVGVTASSAKAGLVAHWTFDEAPGGTAAADSSVNGNDATLRNGTTVVNPTAWDTSTTDFGATFKTGGKIGNHLFVNNTNEPAVDEDSNDYAAADTYTGVLGTGARSVAAWIFLDSSIKAHADVSNPSPNPTADGMSGNQTIISWGGSAVDGNAWYVRADGNNTGAGTNGFQLRVEVAGNGQQAGTLPVDEWVHIAVAWESTAGANNDLTLYVNGGNEGDFDFTETVDTTGTAGVYVGTLDILEGFTRSFAGGLDDVRIYDHKLSQAEVNVLAGLGLAGDFDQDGDVDGADFLLWQRDTSVGSLTNWQNNFGTTASLPAVNAVPEPASVVLVIAAAMSVMGLMARRRRHVM